VPAVITSDRGAQFASALWAALCSLLDIHHIPTTAFHPEGNGLVERFHRMKDVLRAQAAHADWAAHLPWVMLSLRAAPCEDDGRSPAEALYGAQLVVPGQFLDGVEPPLEPFLRSLEAAADSFKPAPARHNIPIDSKPSAISEELLVARFVFVRRDDHLPPLTAAYDGPYRVLHCAPYVFELQLGSRVDSVSVHRLNQPMSLMMWSLPVHPPAAALGLGSVPLGRRMRRCASWSLMALATFPVLRSRLRPPPSGPGRFQGSCVFVSL